MNTMEINIECMCPHCNQSAGWNDVDALVNSGTVPQTEVTCYRCRGVFIVEATLDIGFTAKETA